MAKLTRNVAQDKIETGFGVVIGLLAAITVIRLVCLAASDVDLFTDEGQYWDWSRELSWGYFSKPECVREYSLQGC